MVTSGTGSGKAVSELHEWLLMHLTLLNVSVPALGKDLLPMSCILDDASAC